MIILYNPLLTVPAHRAKIIRKIRRSKLLKERKKEDDPTAQINLFSLYTIPHEIHGVFPNSFDTPESTNF